MPGAANYARSAHPASSSDPQSLSTPVTRSGNRSVIVVLTPVAMMVVSLPSIPASAILAPAPIRHSFWRGGYDHRARSIDGTRQVLNCRRGIWDGRCRVVVRRGRSRHIRGWSTIADAHIDLCMTWHRGQRKSRKQRERRVVHQVTFWAMAPAMLSHFNEWAPGKLTRQM